MDLPAAPILFVIVLWWGATGAVFLVGAQGRGARRLAMAAMSVAALGALAGAWLARDMATPAGAYLGFSAALVLWAWHEMSFLFGYVTGPRRGRCPIGARGWRRFRFAAETLIHHELAIAATAAALAALLWGEANAAAAWTFAVLFAMRLSAKLNLFFGVPNFADDLLPGRLDYLQSYFRTGPISPLFPATVTAATALAVWLLWSAASAGAAFDKTQLALLGALAALAALEHWFLVLPVPDAALWRWMLPSRDARPAPPPAGERPLDT